MYSPSLKLTLVNKQRPEKRLALRKVIAAVSVVLSDLRLDVVACWLAMEFVHGTKVLQGESPGIFSGEGRAAPTSVSDGTTNQARMSSTSQFYNHG